ncbi:hypothetical protein JQ543_19920 [Bradyrhizobium diazoefficiens]|nr:hypothetical protein [Bradyrhizobium diazoefficiens]MBR0850029.1 hypothetical protein [Bradyrhizobium diazoefficiens]
MRNTIYVAPPISPASQDWLAHAVGVAQTWTLFTLWLLIPFAVGLLAGLAFTSIIRRRGWRTQIIPSWVLPVMFGTFAYAVTPGLLYIVGFGLWPRSILAGLTASLIFAWPIWLVMAPVLFLYLTYLTKREKWLRDSTVIYLSAFALASESIFLLWFMP